MTVQNRCKNTESLKKCRFLSLAYLHTRKQIPKPLKSPNTLHFEKRKSRYDAGNVMSNKQSS